MTFAAPELLLGLLLIPLALVGYLFVARRRSRYAVRFTNVDLLANLVPRRPAWRRHVPPLLYVAAASALVLALARPSMVVAVPRDEATIILTMDVSASMRATDVAPNRMKAAQDAARAFVEKLPERFQVGLVTFSTDAVLRVPPTTDRDVIYNALARLRADGGTAMGDAIDESLAAAGLDQESGAPTADASPDPAASADPSASPDPPASPAPSAGADQGSSGEPPLVATVLLSDGASTTGKADPISAAGRAAALGVPVYTIALGTADGEVEVEDNFGRTQRVPVPPDTETLAKIAELTDARFFEAPTEDDLTAIYENLGSRVGTTTEEQEVTFAFAAGGLILMIVGAAAAAWWFNRFP
jgi:Ca-activated chloride channel family protein